LSGWIGQRRKEMVLTSIQRAFNLAHPIITASIFFRECPSDLSFDCLPNHHHSSNTIKSSSMFWPYFSSSLRLFLLLMPLMNLSYTFCAIYNRYSPHFEKPERS
jgi:hypothetical protein